MRKVIKWIVTLPVLGALPAYLVACFLAAGVMCSMENVMGGAVDAPRLIAAFILTIFADPTCLIFAVILSGFGILMARYL